MSAPELQGERVRSSSASRVSDHHNHAARAGRHSNHIRLGRISASPCSREGGLPAPGARVASHGRAHGGSASSRDCGPPRAPVPSRPMGAGRLTSDGIHPSVLWIESKIIGGLMPALAVTCPLRLHAQPSDDGRASSSSDRTCSPSTRAVCHVSLRPHRASPARRDSVLARIHRTKLNLLHAAGHMHTQAWKLDAGSYSSSANASCFVLHATARADHRASAHLFSAKWTPDSHRARTLRTSGPSWYASRFPQCPRRTEAAGLQRQAWRPPCSPPPLFPGDGVWAHPRICLCMRLQALLPTPRPLGTADERSRAQHSPYPGIALSPPTRQAQRAAAPSKPPPL